MAIADGYATLESKEEYGWLMTERLVVKPDQVIKRRGKAGLVGLNLTWQEVKQWITERMDREVLVGQVKGVLNSFIVEPFVPHEQDEEMYVSIFNTRQGEKMLFYHEGGVDVGDVDAKAEKIDISLSCTNCRGTVGRTIKVSCASCEGWQWQASSLRSCACTANSTLRTWK